MPNDSNSDTKGSNRTGIAPGFTEEDRLKAQETRKAKAAAAAHYKRDWLDSGLWDELAKARGIRLPLWSKVPTPRFLKRWHESLDTEPFEAVYGCSPSRLITLNPDTPLRAFVGMMLERASPTCK
jgi:hypothetical protein